MPEKSRPPETHKHSLLERPPGYPIHRIGIIFMDLLPLLARYLLIGDIFTNWCETIPFPDQIAPTTANALLQN